MSHQSQKFNLLTRHVFVKSSHFCALNDLVAESCVEL